MGETDQEDDAPPADGQELASRWLDEIGKAEKVREPWLRRCERIDKRYKDERENATDAPRARRRFNIFWSNVETLKPAIYARTPKADVGRRYKDADPVGRVASELIERALNYSGDAYDFDGRMKACRDQFLLVGRASAWVRYTATFQPAATTASNDDAETLEYAPSASGQISDEPEELVDTETVEFDHVSYQDFLHGPGRSWAEVPWVGRKAYLTRKELIARFGEEIGKAVTLDFTPDGCSEDDRDGLFKKAIVYEVWDRPTKSAIWLSRGYPADVLDHREDPLGLQDFFPCPPPMLATTGLDSLLPVPDFLLYQDQADEIDDLTDRIRDLCKMLKVRGFYAGQHEEKLANLLNGENGDMVSVDGWQAVKDGGGLKGLVDYFPTEMVITTLRECIATRKQMIDDVYQVTGISDIMRGDTDPDETKGAQVLKSTWGSSRVRDRQKEMARFARDILRIKAQVIAAKFQPKTLSVMTDVQLLTAAEKQQIALQQQAAQQAAAIAQQSGQPPPPAVAIDPAKLELMTEPSWDDVMQLMGSKTLLRFRIDVESDSTAEPDEQEEKQRRIEFVEAIGKFVANSLPVVQTQPALLPLIMESLKFLVRGFRAGREMEDIIDQATAKLEQAAQQPQPQQQLKGPDPQAQQMQAQASLIKAQAAAGGVQNDRAHLQIEAQRAAAEHQAAMAGVQAENMRTQADTHAAVHATNTDAQVAMHGAQLDQQTQLRQAVEKAEQKNLIHEINDHTPIQARTP